MNVNFDWIKIDGATATGRATKERARITGIEKAKIRIGHTLKPTANTEDLQRRPDPSSRNEC